MKKKYNAPVVNIMIFEKENIVASSIQPEESGYDRVIKSLKNAGVNNEPVKVKW